ncbi:peptidase [Photobacterium leiognathi subsp. mandapamensis]|nr:peptidase [Photobacterium leiognathi subsp. mandapamensis]
MKKIILLLPLMSASVTAESFDEPHLLPNKATTVHNKTDLANLSLKQPSNFSAFPTWENHNSNEPLIYRPQDFTDLGNKTIVNLVDLAKKAPNTFMLKKQPWSDSYWPTRYGGIAWRYTKSDIDGSNFKAFYDYTFKKRPTNTFQGDDRNNLSPAEKYDLLVGDKALTLTKQAWDVGIIFGGLQGDGDLSEWLGICNGWAGAAMQVSRPVNAVTVKDANGEDLTFYPSDIKALADQLWGNALKQNQYRQLGQRCYPLHPERINGRETDRGCRDVNPGSWHIVVLNQIGISHKSFVLDIDGEGEIWNQPAVGYSIEYFNPQTGEKSANPLKVAIPRSEYKKDKFSQFRDDSTTSIVGVNMKFTYTDENFPNHNTPNTKADDLTDVANYIYDLELDDHGNIIGGEWHSQNHPDFLWVTKKGMVIQSDVKVQGKWNISEPIPTEWQDKAVESSKQSQPLSSIVYTLVNAAQDVKPKVQWRPLVTQGQCLNVYNNYTFDGALVLTTKCDGSDNQKWTLTSEGFLHPHNVPQLCFATSNIVKCTNDPKQKWHLDNNKHLINALGQQATFNGQTSPVSATAKGSQWHWGN